MALRPWAFLLAVASLAACSSDLPLPSGSCAVDPTLTTACNTTPTDGGAPASLGLVGYSCTGGARPDQTGSYAGGVPQGLICANQLGAAGAPAGTETYCCTGTTTTCAYDPVAVCDPGTYAYQCQNVNRPESYNPTIQCGQGTRGTEYVDYCCSGTGLPTGCGENDSLGCPGGLVGWRCPVPAIPRGQDLLANKSRADQYYLLCSIPKSAPQPAYDDYCCYPPAALPPGGSCVEDLTVPGCASGRFGFACYGADTPADDFPPMSCPDPGSAGRSAQGYPATLYCCDFE